MKISRSDKTFDIINNSILLLFTLLMLYPLYFIIIASISEPMAIVKGEVILFPVNFQLTAYKNILQEASIWIGYRNSIFYTLLGTLYNLALTIPAAYVITKKELPGRNILIGFFLVTMFFSGGMIPTYLNMKNLGLLNTPWALILGAGVSCWNLIITREFFKNTIPTEIYESAHMDGASEFRAFFNIALPLSKPILAVMTLYYGVAHWNSYYSALLYIRKPDLFPLQLVLRNILISNEMSLTQALVEGDSSAIAVMVQKSYMVEAMKYSLIFVASFPLLCAYPFVQKYFVKGMMIGSVKG
jgi:putative aldouronate transport system permease protein